MKYRPRHPYRCRLCLKITDEPSEQYPETLCIVCVQRERSRVDSNNKKKRINKYCNGQKIKLYEWISCLEHHDFKCATCKIRKGRKNLTLDHIISIGSGGSNSISNVQPLCFTCHAIKDGNVKTKLFSRKKISLLYKKYKKRLVYITNRLFRSLKNRLFMGLK